MSSPYDLGYLFRLYDFVEVRRENYGAPKHPKAL